MLKLKQLGDFMKQTLRYLHTGWWIVHLVGISFVYSLGHLLWP